MFSEAQLKLLRMPIKEIGYSVRTSNSLLNADIAYVHELVQKTEAQLLGKSVRNFGRICLNEVNEFLNNARGLHLGMEFTPEQLAFIKGDTMTADSTQKQEGLESIGSSVALMIQWVAQGVPVAESGTRKKAGHAVAQLLSAGLREGGFLSAIIAEEADEIFSAVMKNQEKLLFPRREMGMVMGRLGEK